MNYVFFSLPVLPVWSWVSILVSEREVWPFWRPLIKWQGLVDAEWDDWDKVCKDKRTGHSIDSSSWSQEDDEDIEVEVEILVDDVWETSGLIKFKRPCWLLKLASWWSSFTELVEEPKFIPEVEEFEVKGGASEEYFLDSKDM